MSIEGHWTVRFASVAGDKVQRESGGVITLRGGQALGGDTWTYYSGTYQLDGSKIELRVNVAVHFTEGGESILGGPLVPYTLVGVAEVASGGRQLHAEVHVEGLEEAKIIAILNKVADIR